ncbi:Clp protease ClpB [Sporosarcina sp. ACRSL]|uniref:Clp protease ClpB n=1 Tax=Sporosarcina sp. ACRSL TaxID=2918215 RepID=UPI001EF721DC|nr:Clp protease ClpB [Sporosarcina sp. ACRSL]MCG7344854.1 Clp protease ClpB [Sporosarcina sp. ACRSL]
MKQTTYLIGVLILGLSIVLSAFILSNSSSKSTSKENESQMTNSTPDLMTTTQLANYLQISEQALENIILRDDSERAELSSYDTYRFVPYLKINDEKRFMKVEIDEWLKYLNDHNYR